jgi:ethanolamine utilization protein EutM
VRISNEKECSVIKAGIEEKTMANPAIGMIETKGLVALVQATDAMLKAAPVEFAGWKKIGSGLCTVVVTGDVGAIRAAVEAGAAAARAAGEVKSVHIIPRPHGDLKSVLPK